MQKLPFILASASPRRLSLLKDIGIAPDKVVPAEIDERQKRGELPRHMTARLSLDKLKTAVAQINGEAVVIAADTIVACGRRVLPKAENDDEVRNCLKLLSGRRHHVLTSVAVQKVPGGRIFQKTSDSVVSFKRMTDQEIEYYVKSGEGIGKAGGYAIQGKAAIFISSIRGSYSNIVGLPLFETARLLEQYGFLR